VDGDGGEKVRGENVRVMSRRKEARSKKGLLVGKREVCFWDFLSMHSLYFFGPNYALSCCGRANQGTGMVSL